MLFSLFTLIFFNFKKQIPHVPVFPHGDRALTWLSENNEFIEEILFVFQN